MFKTLRTALCVLGALLPAALPSVATAGSYPVKPIQLIVPYGPGGDSDLTARVWAEFAKQRLGQPVVVVNKAGGGGLAGTLAAAKARPDGYTLYLVQAGPVLILPQTASAGYTFDSFAYIARVMIANCAVVVRADAPWKDLNEFGADAKTNPGKYIFATPGATAWLTFAMRNWQSISGAQLKQVEYQSGAETINAVVGGHADMNFMFPQTYAPMVRAGKLKILAIGAKSKDFPDAPTFADLGIKGNYFGWAGIAAPKGTPKEIIDKLTAVTEDMSKDPAFAKAIENMGAMPDFTAGEAWMRQLKEQQAEMTRVLRNLNMLKK